MITGFNVSIDVNVNGKIVTLVDAQSSTDQYGFLYHDYYLHGMSRPTLNGASRRFFGLPETVAVLDKNGYVELTEDIQWAWYNWNTSLVNQSQAENISDFLSLTASDRAFTNRYGSNQKGSFPACACYPAGTNLDKENMRLFPLLMGGAYIKITGGVGTSVLTYETMSSSEDLSKYSPKTHPHLFYSATNSRREEIWKDKDGNLFYQYGQDKWHNSANQPIVSPPASAQWTGKWVEDKVDPFPQFDRKAVVPIITRNARENKVESYRVKLLPKGSMIPSPFVF